MLPCSLAHETRRGTGKPNKRSTGRGWLFRPTLERLQERYPSRIEDSSEDDPPFQLLTVYRGMAVDVDTAITICREGFSDASLRNDGWFGRGVYFTPDLDCARAYARSKTGPGVEIVANILLFQPYPVIEQPFCGPNAAGYKGQSVPPNCDANIATVRHSNTLKDATVPLPPTEWIGEGHEGGGDGTTEMTTEIVISDLQHVLPRCILKFASATSSGSSSGGGGGGGAAP
jgi:hypothetical protein